MTKHSKGPWKYEPSEWSSGIAKQFRIYRPDKLFIAETEQNFDIDIAEHEANARLISAAPDLLKACETVDAALALLDQEKFAGCRLALRTAIKKARGSR